MPPLHMSKPKKVVEVESGPVNGNQSHARAPSGKEGKLVSPKAAPPAPVEVYSPKVAIAFMDTLARRFNPDDLADRLEAMLDAETPPIVTKDGKILVRPDNPTRLRALEFIYAYVVGRPIERQQIVNQTTGGSLEDFMAKCQASPVFRDTVLRMLEGMGG